MRHRTRPRVGYRKSARQARAPIQSSFSPQRPSTDGRTASACAHSTHTNANTPASGCAVAMAVATGVVGTEWDLPRAASSPLQFSTYLVAAAAGRRRPWDPSLPTVPRRTLGRRRALPPFEFANRGPGIARRSPALPDVPSAAAAADVDRPASPQLSPASCEIRARRAGARRAPLPPSAHRPRALGADARASRVQGSRPANEGRCSLEIGRKGRRVAAHVLRTHARSVFAVL